MREVLKEIYEKKLQTLPAATLVASAKEQLYFLIEIFTYSLVAQCSPLMSLALSGRLVGLY